MVFFNENQTKIKIAETFIKAVSESPDKLISVQEIAEKAQVNRQTFYYHFKDRDQLIEWIFNQDALKHLSEEEVSIDNWEEQALKMLKAMIAHDVFYQAVLKERRELLTTTFSHRIQLIFEKIFQEVKIGYELSRQEVQFYSRFFSFGCTGLFESWIYEGYQETPLVMATQLFQLAKDIEFLAYRLYDQQEEGIK
ncbi:TetR/AcrR family transcriptional regulator C-terminal domain-containing protein [Enterococcus lemanii]|uniref:TetR/AcrR family transcriptional regulator C-terminal domain-containing protein n=1 Tax=Enterococcus lemanii TaxID=1159752 RepID=A0ABV9MXS0_9ENTE|nr:TetR/AcrR family transcriptional regulator C-terminal domain-containing protein [Enterococcus lemanii]MBM7707992.1 AcrR family transcriptional regulator [Enterococcus lemanii]NLM68152.1 TetR family transcriptional regulator [Enterococcus sp.]